ncbi:hypothetical protein DL93DRAFT_1252069 [Clavulina sp. PMI_390]|nr:hypothetical protein DL93DRAFT_1252069 [Clavulina sp. PMI_390]
MSLTPPNLTHPLPNKPITNTAAIGASSSLSGASPDTTNHHHATSSSVSTSSISGPGASSSSRAGSLPRPSSSAALNNPHASTSTAANSTQGHPHAHSHPLVASTSQGTDPRRSQTPLSAASPRGSPALRSHRLGGSHSRNSKTAHTAPPAAPPRLPPAKRTMTHAEMKAKCPYLEKSAKTLKRSGEARVQARPFPGSREPNPKSPRSSLIGCLEMTESLVQWIYFFWLQDEMKVKGNNTNWPTIFGLIGAVKSNWTYVPESERQKAMLALMYVLRFFFFFYSVVVSGGGCAPESGVILLDRFQVDGC